MSRFFVVVVVIATLVVLMQFKNVGDCCKTVDGCASGIGVTEKTCTRMDGELNEGKRCNLVSGQCE